MKTLMTLVILSFSLSALAQSQQVEIRGVIEIKEPVLNLDFELVAMGEDYGLKVTPQGSKEGCTFEVSRLSSPMQTRGVDGVIFSSKSDDCEFKSSQHAELLNGLRMIDLSYRLDRNSKVVGRATLDSLGQTYQGTIKAK